MSLTAFNGFNFGKVQTQNAVGGGAVGGWVELGRTTLGSANSTITVSGLPNKRYYQVLTDITGESSNSDFGIQFNSDSGANYARRYNYNGAGEGTNINMGLAGVYVTDVASTTPIFCNSYIANYSTKEKLMINNGLRQNTVGAGTAPSRSEVVSKWANTSNAISSISVTTAGAPTFNSGSEVVVLGYDPADTHTTNFWEELADVSWTSGGTINTGTFTAKKYLWIQCWWKGDSSVTMRVNSDSGANYARRYSNNGGADGTDVSQTSFHPSFGFGTLPHYNNLFIINNSANEKLALMNTVYQNTAGAGTAPMRGESVLKWANTSNQITSFNVSASTAFTGGQIKVWGSN